MAPGPRSGGLGPAEGAILVRFDRRPGERSARLLVISAAGVGRTGPLVGKIRLSPGRYDLCTDCRASPCSFSLHHLFHRHPCALIRPRRSTVKITPLPITWST